MICSTTEWPHSTYLIKRADLNPIEHIWYHLKKLVLEMHPELNGIGKGEQAIEALENALIEA